MLPGIGGLLSIKPLIAQIIGQTYSTSDSGSNNCEVYFQNNGIVHARKHQNNTGVNTTLGTDYNWLLEGTAAEFEIMAAYDGAHDPVGGSVVGSWLPLSATQYWYTTAPNTGNIGAAGLIISIRRKDTGEVVASAIVHLSTVNT